MPIITETQLNADIKSGRLASVYFLYGEESFLTRTYAERIKNKVLGENQVDINLLELDGNPDLSMLSDHVDSLPFFADFKVIMINDFNPEKISEDDTEQFISIIENVPDTTILVFYLTSCTFSQRSERVKKIFAAIKKYACVCEFKPMNKMKIGELISKKAAKQKRLISRTNAEYLAEITACDLTLASAETTKLCSYVSEGQEISRDIIDTMVAKKLETKVYTLTDAIISGNTLKAMKILDELSQQRVDPIPVLSTLSGAYLEYYCAKAAKNEGVISQQVAADFGYTGAKASFAAKKYNEAAKMDIQNLRDSMTVIFDADLKCKSSNIDRRILLEETVLKLIARK